MTIEVLPNGVTCNLSCPYCYQHPIRDAGNFEVDYNLDLMKAAIEQEVGDPKGWSKKHPPSFTIFGGEATLMRPEDMEDMFRWGFERYNKNAIQTNGVLLNDNHFRMFKQYNVGVGFSMDGPGEMNDSRWAGSIEKTRTSTAKSQANLERCLREGIGASMIVTVGRHNGLPESRQALKQWIADLEAVGLVHCRLHMLEVDHPDVAAKMALTIDQMIDFFLDMYAFELARSNIKFDLFGDIRRLMCADDRDVTCTWHACDPWTTDAVRGINGDGSRSNCGRTNKEGINFVKADVVGRERQLALYSLPFKDGGCGGCRFWSMCKGQCPGTGEGQDPRRKTEHCLVWMKLFEVVEREMKGYNLQPLSQASFRPELEQRMFTQWAQGKPASLHVIVKEIIDGKEAGAYELDASGHGDHTDNHPTEDHSDAPHQDYQDHGDSDDRSSDVDHGDDHGDHTDTQNPLHDDAE